MNLEDGILQQDEVWVTADGRELRLEEMDAGHRSNLIPFLRGNARTLQAAAREAFYATTPDPYFDDLSDGVANALARMEAYFDTPAEEWLEWTPLMRRLVALEQGIPYLTRMRWAAENKAYELTHGYKKVRHG